MNEEFESFNTFGVGRRETAAGPYIVVVLWPRLARGMTPQEALNLAAYLVVLADKKDDIMAAVEAVERT